jgi:hypothetical protein
MDLSAAEVYACEEGLAACVEHRDYGRELCVKLGPQGLACLEASSKTYQTVVHAVVARENLRLLDSALATAQSSTASHGAEQQHKQAVWWLAALLLRVAPHAAGDVAERLVNLPEVPLVVAKQLVSGGLRISYAQLLAAANSMVAGVEVWVQAQQQLGIQTDIPAAAVAICCGESWVSGAGTAGECLEGTILCRTASRHV